MGGLSRQSSKKYWGWAVLPLRGGNWNDGLASGVFALNLNNPRAATGDNVGFRAALLSSLDVAALRGCIQYREDKGACLHAERQKTGLSWMPRIAWSEIRNT